ncbi:hypothetical protein HanRHA438_Chr01g0007701 [Helianthus annuus]|nr:hypothetical protein HanRHA438_Chr01g0007701 [Helianthus annuus]
MLKVPFKKLTRLSKIRLKNWCVGVWVLGFDRIEKMKICEKKDTFE